MPSDKDDYLKWGLLGVFFLLACGIFLVDLPSREFRASTDGTGLYGSQGLIDTNRQQQILQGRSGLSQVLGNTQSNLDLIQFLPLTQTRAIAQVLGVLTAQGYVDSCVQACKQAVLCIGFDLHQDTCTFFSISASNPNVGYVQDAAHTYYQKITPNFQQQRQQQHDQQQASELDGMQHANLYEKFQGQYLPTVSTLLGGGVREEAGLTWTGATLRECEARCIVNHPNTMDSDKIACFGFVFGDLGGECSLKTAFDFNSTPLVAKAGFTVYRLKAMQQQQQQQQPASSPTNKFLANPEKFVISGNFAYEIYRNSDIPGHDLSEATGVSLNACAEHCNRNDQCSGVVYASGRNMCYLKTGSTKQRNYDDSLISIVKLDTDPDHPLPWEDLPNVDFPMLETLHEYLSIPTRHQCVQKCLENDQCYAAIYRNRNCFLKKPCEDGEMPQPVPAIGIHSGRKRQQTTHSVVKIEKLVDGIGGMEPGRLVVAAYTFEASGESQLSCQSGQKFKVLSQVNADWLMVQSIVPPFQSGIIPRNHLLPS